MNSLKLKSYAKINLFLAILNKRLNGYHNINSIMQTVSLHDIIKLKKNRKKIICKINDKSIPTNEENLAVKAAQIFFNHFKINYGIKISIKKNIPQKAGLAGGSSNAATTLIGLNTLFNTKAKKETLLKLASKIGSDVAFLISGGTSLIEGTGTIVKEIAPLKNCYIVITKPNFNVNTKIAYEKFDEKNNFKNNISNNLKINISKKIEKKIEKNSPIKEIAKFMFNDFEKIFYYDENHYNINKTINTIKKIMLKNKAFCSLLTGSGSAIFGIFNDEKDAKKTKKTLNKLKIKTFICNPIKKYL